MKRVIILFIVWNGLTGCGQNDEGARVGYYAESDVLTVTG